MKIVFNFLLVGSIWTDFKPQIEQLNRKELTIVAWDPPGYGNSRPPDREFPIDFYEKDAVYAHDLMKKLGFSNYSLVGWSDGGNTSMIIAAMYPKTIQKLVIFGSNASILPEEMEIYEGKQITSSKPYPFSFYLKDVF